MTGGLQTDLSVQSSFVTEDSPINVCVTTIDMSQGIYYTVQLTEATGIPVLNGYDVITGKMVSSAKLSYQLSSLYMGQAQGLLIPAL